MLTLWGNLLSGNDYKVRLLLTQLGHDYAYEERDLFNGETRTPEFLAINPNGRIPTVRLADGRILTESNAIMFYFAEGGAFLPDDRYERAQALQWMFFEQYSHEPFIAVARFWLHTENGGEVYADALPEKWEKGHQALRVMEQHLTSRDFFAGGQYSIADISLYAYSHVADEGGFDLAPYGAIRRWLDRVADQPAHILIDQATA